MTDDERELVYRIGQACWWLLLDPASADSIDRDRAARIHVREKLGQQIHALREKHGYEAMGDDDRSRP